MSNRIPASQILERFAEQRRRVFSEWRVLIEYRRFAHAEGAPLPGEKAAIKVVHKLLKGAADSVEGVRGVYIATVPYASVLQVSEEQIVQEADPWAVISHLTAMAYHGLTDVIPGRVEVTSFGRGFERRLPLGTTPDDWVDLEHPRPTHPGKVRGVDVRWTSTKDDWDFGHTVGYSHGVPIYVTDPERTLIDAIRTPAKSGGIAKVFQAWRHARTADLDRLVGYVERFDSPLLRQRVGFLLQRLGLAHPKLEGWRGHLLRGGSLKLDAEFPYSPVYSAEWNLSLNVPESVLAELDEE